MSEEGKDLNKVKLLLRVAQDMKLESYWNIIKLYNHFCKGDTMNSQSQFKLWLVQRHDRGINNIKY